MLLLDWLLAVGCVAVAFAGGWLFSSSKLVTVFYDGESVWVGGHVAVFFYHMSDTLDLAFFIRMHVCMCIMYVCMNVSMYVCLYV